MKKIFLYSLFSILFAGIFGLSASNVSAAEIEEPNTIQLEMGKEKIKTQIITDENGEEEARVTITDITPIPPKNNGMIQPLGTSVVSNNINDGTYNIKWSRYGGLYYASYNITVKNKKIVNASGLSYRLPLVTINGYELYHTDLKADMTLFITAGLGGATLGSWTGELDALIVQGMVTMHWN